MQDKLPQEEIPVIGEADVAVVGGSFAGLAGAIQLEKHGRKVFLIEPRTYLGWELTAVLRPWLKPGPGERAAQLPEVVRFVLERNAAKNAFGEAAEVMLHPDDLKRSLEDALAAAGIELLYASLPVGVLEQEGKLTGLVIANKSGRQVVRCRTVLDASETALAAALCGEDVSGYAGGSSAVYLRTLEFTDVGEMPGTLLAVPEELKLIGSRLRLREGCRGKGHVLVEFGMVLDSANSLDSCREREIEARHRSMQLAVHLMHHVPAFAKAVWGASSHELLGPFPLTLTGEPQEQEFPQPRPASLHADTMTTTIPGIWSMFKDVYRGGGTGLLDAVQAAFLGESLAAHILQGSSEGTTSGSPPEELAQAVQTVPETKLPVLKQADVLVVGGGTSGACAASTAAEEGMNTVLLELNPGLGGTATYGGVDSYWFGRRVGYADRIHSAVLEVQQSLNYKGAKWNIESKMYALLQKAQRSGVDFLLNAITFGAVMDGNKVCGAAVATRHGPFIVRAEAVIDATGDGDVAAFAGAKYVYGSAKDGTVMWYSLAQFQTPTKIQNNFTSMVDVSNVRDYTRAILAGRRRGTNCHDHGIYVATRESRHILGDVVMSMSDQLLHRGWPDVVNIHFSNHDVKGVSGADWVNIGLIPPNLEIEIPYRMLLPKGLEGLLIAGKAISATHDALPAIRMQADLENLGAVSALAAAMAVRGHTVPRQINVKELQSRLVREQLLPDTVLTRSLERERRSDEDLVALAASIEAEEPLYEYSNMRMNEVFRSPIPFVEIISAGPRIIPYLERELAHAEGMKSVRLAQALCMLGSASGIPILIREIMEALSGSGLPRRTADIMYVQLPPDHGAMPDTAYYLYSLAQARDKRSIPVWQRVADLLQPTEEDFKDTWQGIFYYVDAVCQGAERLGDPAAIPVLEQMHRIAYLREQQCREGAQADYFLERRAMLELAIGRALARCGSPAGYTILIEYTADVRSLLAKQAQMELQRLTGEAFGKDRERLRAWLSKAGERIRPQPLDLRLDIESDSESILRRYGL